MAVPRNALDDLATVLAMAQERLQQMRAGINLNATSGKVAKVALRAGSLAVARYSLEHEDGKKYLASLLLDGP